MIVGVGNIGVYEILYVYLEISVSRFFFPFVFYFIPEIRSKLIYEL
jgi:hypothetical protein